MMFCFRSLGHTLPAMISPAPLLVAKGLRLVACLLISLVGVTCPGAQPAAAAGRAALPANVKRVVLLGDSITYAGTYVSLVEAYFVTRYPAQAVEFINLGLPS